MNNCLTYNISYVKIVLSFYLFCSRNLKKKVFNGHHFPIRRYFRKIQKFPVLAYPTSLVLWYLTSIGKHWGKVLVFFSPYKNMGDKITKTEKKLLQKSLLNSRSADKN